MLIQKPRVKEVTMRRFSSPKKTKRNQSNAHLEEFGWIQVTFLTVFSTSLCTITWKVFSTTSFTLNSGPTHTRLSLLMRKTSTSSLIWTKTLSTNGETLTSLIQLWHSKTLLLVTNLPKTIRMKNCLGNLINLNWILTNCSLPSRRSLPRGLILFCPGTSLDWCLSM